MFRQSETMTTSCPATVRIWRWPGARAAWLALPAALLALPLVASDYWLKGILIPALIYALATLGLNFVTGYAGLISLGQAAFMAIGAFMGVISYGRYGVPLLASILIAGVAAALVGAVVGIPSLRIRGLYLLVATLAAQFIVTWTLQRVPWFGAASFGTVNTPPVRIAGWLISSGAEQYYLTLAVVAALTLFGRNVVRSRVGRAWIAIRERDVAAASLGISMFRYKLLAFMISSFYAGVAGALVVFAWVGAANVQEYSLDLSIQILGMVIIGGMGTVTGSFLGAGFVTLMPILINVSLGAVYRLVGHTLVSSMVLANVEHVVFGTLILIFLIVEPRGLARLVSASAARLSGWRSTG
jgi:branched-chain amino acid transport system permease protein